METILRNSEISFPGLGLTLNPPSSFSLFGRDVYLYGAIIAFAFMVCIFYCAKKSRRLGIREDDVYDVLLLLMPLGIVGARLYFVLFNLEYYLANPSEIIAVWNGGLAIYGGVIAGVLVIFFVSRRKGIPVPAMLDLFLTACILGQAIGRWGNFTNREAFGSETGIFCRMGLTTVSGGTVYVHPTFLYESLWNVTGFIILNTMITRGLRKYDGQCALVYCLWYGTGRAMIEGLRTDSLYIPGTEIRVSRLLSALLALTGLALLLVFRKRRGPLYSTRTQ